MVSFEESLVSCGVYEISGIGRSPAAVTLKDVGQDIKDWWEPVIFMDEEDHPRHTVPAFIIFSHHAGNRRGKSLRALIEKKGLGTVWTSDARKNENSGNHIVVYVWTVDQPAFVKWIEENC